MRANREALLKAKRKAKRKAEYNYAPKKPTCKNCGAVLTGQFDHYYRCP
jgi:tRNA(Ile2) C34 agmatinyltransferase TiaS